IHLQRSKLPAREKRIRCRANLPEVLFHFQAGAYIRNAEERSETRFDARGSFIRAQFDDEPPVATMDSRCRNKAGKGVPHIFHELALKKPAILPLEGYFM